MAHIDRVLGQHMALLLVVDVVSKLHAMNQIRHGHNEVVCFVNYDSTCWVEQQFQRRVYIKERAHGREMMF